MDNSVPPSQPVVPVSSQPLTLDPNNLSQPGVAQTDSAQPTSTPASPAQATPAPQPQYPISGPHKEAAPIPVAPVQEYLRPTEVEPQLQPEVQEAGVEVVENKEQPQLTQEHKAVGIEHAKESVPVTYTAPQMPQLPYTQVQAKEIEKTTAPYDSRHWLATLTDYILRKLQGGNT